MRTSQNRRGIRFHSWNGILTEAESLIAIQRPIGIGAHPSPDHPFQPLHLPETDVISIPGDNHGQEVGPMIGTTKESASG